MIYDALKIMVQAFKACVNWFDQLVNATGSQYVIIAAVSLVIVIGMLFIPMRGGRLFTDYGTTMDFTVNQISNARYRGRSKKETGLTVTNAGGLSKRKK